MTHGPVTSFRDDFLRSDLKAFNTRERAATAGLLARMAEFDRRRLYRNDSHDSMHAWCVAELNMTPYTAFAYIRAARTARRFPAILPMLADARLNVTAVILLKPYLTAGNADDLLQRAAGLSKQAIAEMLARRFPRTESLPLVIPVASTVTAQEVALETPTKPVPPLGSQPCSTATGSPEPARELGLDPVVRQEMPVVETPVAPSPRASVQPIAAARYDVRFSMGQEMQDDLRLAQDLAADEVPPGDLASIFHLALKAYIRDQKKRKFAATNRPQKAKAASGSVARRVPAHVKRQVAERDGYRCTFVGDNGRRCGTRRHLEFDHIVAVARGGQSIVPNLRLRCRPHNQLEAERTFGAEFMRHKRESAAAGQPSGARE